MYISYKLNGHLIFQLTAKRNQHQQLLSKREKDKKYK